MGLLWVGLCLLWGVGFAVRFVWVGPWVRVGFIWLCFGLGRVCFGLGWACFGLVCVCFWGVGFEVRFVWGWLWVRVGLSGWCFGLGRVCFGLGWVCFGWVCVCFGGVGFAVWFVWVCFGCALGGLGLLWVRWLVPRAGPDGRQRGRKIEAASRQQFWKSDLFALPRELSLSQNPNFANSSESTTTKRQLH